MAAAVFLLDYLAFRLLLQFLLPRLMPAKQIAMASFALVAVTAASMWFECDSSTLLIIGGAIALASLSMPGNGLASLTEGFGRWRFALYLLSVATTAAIVFICLPISTFLTSPGELSIHLDHLLTTNARDAMIIVYLAALLYALAMTSRMKSALTFLALLGCAIVLVYSYLLPFGYPLMSGLSFEQVPVAGSAIVLRAAIDVLVIVTIGLGVGALIASKQSKFLLSALLLVDVSLGITSGIASFRSREEIEGAAGRSGDSIAQPLRFAKTHDNALVVFLDRFMGSYVEQILESDPHLKDELAGFTWYPRTVSAGENSIAGVHPMFGGYDYTPVEMNARKKSLREQSIEAFSILPYNFSAKGYRVNVVNPRGLGFTMQGDCKALTMPDVVCTHVPQSVVKRRADSMGFPMSDLSRSNYSDLLVLLASMRSAPYMLKQVLYVKGPWRPFLDHSAGTTFREWAELDALDELSAVNSDRPNLNIISNILPHEPYFMGEDCVPRREVFQVSPREVVRRGHASLFSLQHSIAARCALLSVASYLAHLKAEGVYDNTKIVIVSDHGIVGLVKDSSARALAGGTADSRFVRTRSVLLVKERGASGPLRISETFMPNAEVPRIVCEEIGGCVNPYLGNKPIAADGRDDPFYVSFVPWQFSAQQPDAFVIQTQLELRGKDPFDAKGWHVK